MSWRWQPMFCMKFRPVLPNGQNYLGKGIVNGRISTQKRGKNGFGYDPIFVPKNSKLTFGQMKLSLKYEIDHRMKAFKKIKKFF